MDVNYCCGKAHKGIAEVAENIWNESGDKIINLFNENETIKNYTFVITGHPLGAGTASLLNVKVQLERPLGNRTIKCFAFAPPPLHCIDPNFNDAVAKASIQSAIDNCIGYMPVNECVPFLSISCIRCLALLMDTVDNVTENMWFYNRFRLFWEYEAIPDDLLKSVQLAEQNSTTTTRAVDGASKLEIPAKIVIWVKKNVGGSFEAIGCSPDEIAELNVFCCQDMVSDHLPEQYEDALDALCSDTDGGSQ